VADLSDIRYIALEGPIGVGKTNLAKRLARRLGAHLVLEPAAENPFLEKFYADMRQYAFATQVVFLVSRYRQQAELNRRYLFRPLTVSDYILAKDRIFAGLTLSEEEFRLYHQLYDVMASRAATPDVVVLLQARVEVLLDRIRRRGIPYETELEPAYLERLAAAYDEFFRLYEASPLLVVDTSDLDYTKTVIDPDELLAEVAQTRTGRRLYVPGRKE
jgi:deoxyadenosine/deoxycytidine kinase